MKKIYTLIGALAVTSAMFAQDFTKKPLEKYTGTYFSNKVKQNKKTSAAIDVMISPAEGILMTKGIATTNYEFYSNPVLLDSTMLLSDAQGNYTPDCALGYVLDPKSTLMDGTGNPLLTASDAYVIDSLFVPGNYKRVAGSTTTDTLITYVTYAAITPTNTAINVSVPYSLLYIAPISAFSGTLTLMRLKNNSATNGIPLEPVTSAASQTVRVKTLLTALSSTIGVGVKLPTALNVPAGKIVAAYYTFSPGGTHTNGEIFYSYSGGASQTQNGFSGIIASQAATASTANDVSDMFTCVDGTSHSLVYTKKNRYNQAGGQGATLIAHAILNDPIIEFHLTAISTVGVAELDKKGFSLSQNAPNPSNGSSTVTFQLAKDVNSAVFTVTDVMGRIVSSEKVATTTGTHTVKLGAYAAGVYYYSLNVDGVSTTKKMIAE